MDANCLAAQTFIRLHKAVHKNAVQSMLTSATRKCCDILNDSEQIIELADEDGIMTVRVGGDRSDLFHVNSASDSNRYDSDSFQFE